MKTPLLESFLMKFLANGPIFIPPENTRKTFGFLVFSGGLTWEHWPKMSYSSCKSAALADGVVNFENFFRNSL